MHPEYVTSAAHCFTVEKSDGTANPTWEEIVVGFGIEHMRIVFGPLSTLHYTISFH